MNINNQAIARARGHRDPNDGEPYYCSYCGLGWNEYGACEEVDCQLENKVTAMTRYIELPKPIFPVGDYSDVMDH